jgi:hypothetical protein
MRANADGKNFYKTETAAKAFLTRMTKMGYRREDFAIVGVNDYYDNIKIEQFDK